MTIMRGQHLIGRVLGSCVLERVLAYGGTSAVFLAQQHYPERPVAIKVFLPRSSMDTKMQKDFYTRFLREAKAASQLEHPNILPIYSYGEQDGLPYIIMPYMEGGTLREYIVKHGPLSIREAQWYLEQIASALDYAHEHGCVHCDVKPANILLNSDGQVMLADFGIAHLTQANSPDPVSSSGVKAPITLMGTPDYMSPEQALGQPLDGRSDVYSLGIMLFYLLSGTHPFRGASTIAIALLHVHEPPPALGLLRAEVTPEIDRVLSKALAKKPAERFQTADEFRAAFDEAVALSSPKNKSKQQRFSLDAQYMMLTPQPVVHIKATHQRFWPFSRLVSIAALLLIIMLVIAGTVGFFTFNSANGPANASSKIPVSIVHHAVPRDELANTESWPRSSTNSTFFFSGQQYHIRNTSLRYLVLAFYLEHDYANFHLTVSTSQTHGTQDGADYYGVVLRSTDDQSHYYFFEISAWHGGQYQFSYFNGDWHSLAAGPVTGLITSLGKSNVIGIEARGGTFAFSINGKPVGPAIIDKVTPLLTKGEIGFGVEEKGTEVAFSHLYIDVLK
ncbi:MAG: serine/threonine protein kinase [Chloroflexota bacterium]|nr:serine/threonine protein kinase [Chloroflexota bacterium]